MSLTDDATPQVDLVIALAMAEHPGYGRTEQAEFYEAVHMELAPLARQLERDARRYRRQLVDLLSVMPENWREDPDWVALAENQKLKTPNAELAGRGEEDARDRSRNPQGQEGAPLRMVRAAH